MDEGGDTLLFFTRIPLEHRTRRGSILLEPRVLLHAVSSSCRGLGPDDLESNRPIRMV